MANVTTNNGMTGSTMNGVAKDVSKTAQKTYRNATNSLEELSRSVGEKAGEMLSDVSDTAEEYYTASCDYVKANPVKGVAIAAGVGAVLGGISVALMRRH